jgi:hypothetical protein
MAVSIALLLFSLLSAFGQAASSAASARWRRITDGVFLCVLLPLIASLVLVLKVSIGFIVLGVCGYLFVRFRLFQKPLYWIAALLTLGVVYGVYKWITLPQPIEVLFLAHWKRYIFKDSRPFYLAFQWFWCWIAAAALLFTFHIRTIGGLLHALVHRKLLWLELLFVVAVLGIIPPNLIWLYSASDYFTDMQACLAVVVLIAYLPVIWPAIFGKFKQPWQEQRLLPIAILLLMMPFAFTGLQNLKIYTRSASSILHTIMTGLPKALVIPNANTTTLLGLGIPTPHFSASNEPSEPFAPLLLQLNAAYQRPVEEKRLTLIYLPRNHPLWTDYNISNQCFISPFIVPAFTGMGLIDGFPSRLCLSERSKAFAQEGYTFGYSPEHYAGLEKDPSLLPLGFSINKRDAQQWEHTQAAQDENPTALCQKAAAKGFHRVLILHGPDQHYQLQPLSCDLSLKPHP